ncbi:hypothetical protein PLICRDRAFT_122418 [Plicaturopsis crispa FD-325 SS-3]|nr:hypothetical protein PLICRDRAFT_122418 [Plicaturopsis crispa FD-325 SS-3]
MDVPFVSSGSMSRAHYSLVRSVETASSSSVADQHVYAAVDAVRDQLADPALSIKECIEGLVMLLYCSMTVTSGFISSKEIDFALPHAVNLAEAGVSVHAKRIGYLFCAEVMPPDHELQLMLVNTLRKDLESPKIPRICLALDALILSPTEDVIPAVQSRLHDLLSHTSGPVRRRALLAFRALSRYGPEILIPIHSNIQRRLHDSEPEVIGAALTICLDAVNAQPASSGEYRALVNGMLRSSWPIREKPKFVILDKIIRALCVVKPTREALKIVFQLIQYTSTHRSQIILHDAFQLLGKIKTDPILTLQKAPRMAPVPNIRHLLTSRDPNDQLLFLSCLECLDPALWAGTRPETPAVLEEWEMERFMKLLESPDGLIRKKALRILYCVDKNIVEAYFSQALQHLPPRLSMKDRSETAARLLEISQTLSGEDGELYARHVREVVSATEREGDSSSMQHVLEPVVEAVLLHIRDAEDAFRLGCVTTLVASVTDETASLGPTLMVIISALATEHSGRLPVPPPDVIQGLARRLPTHPPAVQEACLLSMLRISADCEDVPPTAISAAKELGQSSKRHIRLRCEQFVRLSSQKEVLATIISSAQSSSLPDFLKSLIAYSIAQPSPPKESPPPTSPTRSPEPRASSRASASPNKLRYTAYEPPKPSPHLRRPPSSLRSLSAGSSSLSDRGSQTSGRGRTSLDELSRTVTAGDLTLAAGGYGDVHEQVAAKKAGPQTRTADIDDLVPRADLMSFDSPFISDPPVSFSSYAAAEPNPVDFKATWNSLEGSNARGWCEASIGSVLERLQGSQFTLQVIAADRPPFEGELKVLISPSSTVEGVPGSEQDSVAALRLKESEEESCLWRLRCADVTLRTEVKRILTDG